MKQFTTLKVGYTWSRMYGNSGEYFTTIVITDKGITSFSHYGQYGSEDRVNNALKDKGYEEKYTPTDYGMMKTKELNKHLFMREKEAIEYVNANF